MFYIIQNGKLVPLPAKIVDDFLITGDTDMVSNFINGFNKEIKIGTVVHGPGNNLFYGLNIVQNEDFTFTINDEDKQQAHDQCPITQLRRREYDSELNAVGKSSFMSLDSSLGWLVIADSPFCYFHSSYLQQMLP